MDMKAPRFSSGRLIEEREGRGKIEALSDAEDHRRDQEPAGNVVGSRLYPSVVLPWSQPKRARSPAVIAAVAPQIWCPPTAKIGTS